MYELVNPADESTVPAIGLFSDVIQTGVPSGIGLNTRVG